MSLIDFFISDLWLGKKSKKGALSIAPKLRQYACIMETAGEEIYYGYPHPYSLTGLSAQPQICD